MQTRNHGGIRLHESWRGKGYGVVGYQPQADAQGRELDRLFVEGLHYLGLALGAMVNTYLKTNKPVRTTR